MGSKEYQAEWHQRNKERRLVAIKERNKRVKAENAQWIRDIKSVTPCADCGVQYPYYVMQFDHIGDDKVVNVADSVARCWSRARIQAEIDKCELVCANCHAVRTFSRKYGE